MGQHGLLTSLSPILSYMPFHAKQVDSWILAVAFAWSMIAPKVLTNRSFDY